MNNGKVRIYALSNELKLDNKEVLAICHRLNIAAKSQSSTISESEAERIRKATKKTVANIATSCQTSSLKMKKDSEDWGYVLIGATIDRLIRHLEGDAALESYPEFRERREHAHELMFECVGQKPCLFYVRRQGAGKGPKEEIWDLTIATDSDVKLPIRL